MDYRLEFPDKESCPPATTNTPVPPQITVPVETGATALDVMIAAADANRDYDFTVYYFGNLGFFTYAVNGTVNVSPCYWFLYYQDPGLPETLLPLGVSNFVVRSSKSTVILRYQHD